eukprot:TRINITY_DN3769_c0_g1_i2.p1 TRINITY_DN3769_c0_g1~~TRINITY_DN3769_c0_g1_i2.p1  ORF type:complete len:461 (-),score=101.53 TRINITY_DN3769_c0_g1_i2:467-1849(-)
MLVNVIKNQQVFNEYFCLFSQDCFYGTVAIDPQVELLHIDKSNFAKLQDNNMIEDLRFKCYAKERYYKLTLEDQLEISNEQLEEYNKQFCKKYGLDFQNIVTMFEKSTSNNKIVTSKYLETHKNKQYDKLFNKSDHKVQFGEKEKIVGQDDHKIQIQPVSEGQTKGLTLEQQISLLQLRSSGQNLRKLGEQNAIQEESEPTKDERKIIKSGLTQSNILEKMTIMQQKIGSKQLDIASPQIIQKMKLSNQTLMKKINSPTQENSLPRASNSISNHEKDVVQGSLNKYLIKSSDPSAKSNNNIISNPTSNGENAANKDNNKTYPFQINNTKVFEENVEKKDEKQQDQQQLKINLPQKLEKNEKLELDENSKQSIQQLQQQQQQQQQHQQIIKPKNLNKNLFNIEMKSNSQNQPQQPVKQVIIPGLTSQKSDNTKSTNTQNKNTNNPKDQVGNLRKKLMSFGV